MAIKLLENVGYTKRPYITVPNLNTEVLPTYFCDPSSEAQKNGALRWVKTYQGAQPQFHTRPNTPMTNLWLEGIESRYNGGRAYKVLNKDDWNYFDIREDQMVQAIQKYGIAPGGKIGGSWVFAMNGTQCKCFLTDSKEYLEAVELDKIRHSTMKKVSLKNLKFGKVYTNKTHDRYYVYVGHHEHEERQSRHNGRSYVTVKTGKKFKQHTFLSDYEYVNNTKIYFFEKKTTVYECDMEYSLEGLKEYLNKAKTYMDQYAQNFLTKDSLRQTYQLLETEL